VVVEDVKKRIAEQRKDGESILTVRAEIEAALDARDAKKLATAQAKSLELRARSHDMYKASEVQLERGKKLAVDASLKSQIEREADQLWNEQSRLNLHIVNVHANQKSAAIEPIGTKKAATILDIPTTHHTKLAAALALDLVALTKELGLLAKALKRTTPGKELVALLRKAKLFERKPLVAPAFK
jgi:vacuolar-type H+-ATPase subunit I/STV1